MKLPEYVKRILGMLAVVTALTVMWSLSYWITETLYDAIHTRPHEFGRLLINSILGFFLFGCSVFLITQIKWVKNRQDRFLHPMIQAMKMMAEGNFNIDLSYYRNQFNDRGDHPYYKIIDSITHMADRLGEMEEMRQEFISNVSHEIQSPLTSISGFAHALKNDSLNPKERERYLHIIEMESVRLSKLSDNLLKLTSLEDDHFTLDREEYRLDHQLRRIILANEPQWTEKKINMDIDLEHVTVHADRDLMDQVWTNLIHNSIKFTPEQGTISIRAFAQTGGKVMVTIKDTGIGMDHDSRMHIFERFYKADESRNRHLGGSGLGLSIVKKIIDLHGGEIKVESELGRGTAMIVSCDTNQVTLNKGGEGEKDEQR
ncbi:two-component sensor histidine kinase [Rossellomorea vietnamensis]|uniref:histidine kinase n=1 Tax=Rossellomorea vietnamensis TaxID=218284 RepID=A0A6I6UMV7_9BACI|nr:HAMP domain-containing sensor histidine kinase [Rossellomorea vietnamensis]QHE62677.1 two-component sensor histidine kinase [Rossellomorea vietnamensis]